MSNTDDLEVGDMVSVLWSVRKEDVWVLGRIYTDGMELRWTPICKSDEVWNLLVRNFSPDGWRQQGKKTMNDATFRNEYRKQNEQMRDEILRLRELIEELFINLAFGGNSSLPRHEKHSTK